MSIKSIDLIEPTLISGDLDTPRAAREIHIRRQIICCRRAKHLEQLASCHTREIRHCPVKVSGDC